MHNFKGGYLALNQKLMRPGMHTHTAAYPDAVSEATIDALNYLQASAFEVDPFVLDVMSQVADSGATIGGIPEADDQPLPTPFDVDVWEAMSPSEKANHKYVLSKIHASNARRESKRESFNRKLGIAREMVGRPIWFPHFLDFRTRMYPLAQDLNPQGDDISKALLAFHYGQPLGETGYRWLHIAVANAAGEDKRSFVQREQWVLSNWELIADSVDNPLDGQRFWATLEDDEPYTFLALAKELIEASRSGDPTSYVSYRPVHIDATCSGLQILSLLGRDPDGALKTNCRAVDERNDLYTEVAEALKEVVSRDAVEGTECAHNVIAKGIDRKTVKRAVMTSPYGVTARGIRDQLISDGIVTGMPGEEGKNASYLTKAIQEALSTTVAAATEIMAYFQEVASVLAARDIPLRWQTPVGSEVTQSYYNLQRKRVQTLCGKFVLWSEDRTAGVDSKKQALAASPNVVHSLDASLAQETVLRLNEEEDISSIACIHDSIGVHAGSVDTLSRVVRESAYHIFGQDFLADFHDYVQSYAGDAPLPEPPQRGKLDVAELLEAPFFFS